MTVEQEQKPIDIVNIVEGVKEATGLGSHAEATDTASTKATLPSTVEIGEGIEAIREAQSKVIPTYELSGTGQVVAEDITKAMESGREWLEEKNRDDLIQKMLTHAAEIRRLQSSEAGKSALRKLLAEPGRATVDALQDLREPGMLEHLAKAVRGLVLSAQFRDAIGDLVAYIQQIVSERPGKESTATAESSTEEVHHSQSQSQVESERKRTKPAHVGKEEGERTYVEAVEEASQTLSESQISESQPYSEIQPRASAAGRRQTDEEIRHMTDRLIDLAQQLHKDEEYKAGLHALVTQLNTLKLSTQPAAVFEGYTKELTSAEGHAVDEILREGKAFSQGARELLERSANISLDDLFETTLDLTQKLRHDHEATEAVEKLNNFMQRVASDANYIQQKEQIEEDAYQVNNGLRRHVIEKYRPSVQHLLAQLRYFLDRLRHDPLAQRLGDDLNSLTKHLFLDDTGNAVLKTELLTDLQKVIPAILRHLRLIRLPNIDIVEPGMRFHATDIVINVGEIAPHHLKLTITSDIPESSNEAVRTLIKFKMSRIRAEARNIRFVIDKSTIPTVVDSGLVDFRIFEDGMQIKLNLTPIVGTHGVGPERKVAAGLQVLKAKTTLDHFDMNIHGSGHDWMYYLLGPYLRRQVKERIETLINNHFMSFDLVASIPVMKSVSATGTVAGQMSAAMHSATETLSSSQPAR